MANSQPIAAVAFDLDNTLIDRDAAFVRLIIDWLAHVNLKKRRLIDWILEEDGGGHSDREEFFRFLAKMNLFKGNRIGLHNRFRREFPSYFEPDPAVEGVLQSLRNRGLGLALLSNGGTEMQRAKLANAGLTKFFESDRILISEEIGCAKPDPEAFRILAERLDIDPGEILYVGDHPEKDIAGAAACGLRTCWINRDPDLDSELSCDYRIASLSELESVCLT